MVSYKQFDDFVTTESMLERHQMALANYMAVRAAPGDVLLKRYLLEIWKEELERLSGVLAERGVIVHTFQTIRDMDRSAVDEFTQALFKDGK